MTIQVGPDPSLPIPLSCNIHSSGDLEIKYGSSSLTHPSTLLHVDLDDLDGASFKTSDFGDYSVAATTVDGPAWTDSGSTVVSTELLGDADPGQEHQIQVIASGSGGTKTATIRVRIREQNANPLP